MAKYQPKNGDEINTVNELITRIDLIGKLRKFCVSENRRRHLHKLTPVRWHLILAFDLQANCLVAAQIHFDWWIIEMKQNIFDGNFFWLLANKKAVVLVHTVVMWEALAHDF